MSKHVDGDGWTLWPIGGILAAGLPVQYQGCMRGRHIEKPTYHVHVGGGRPDLDIARVVNCIPVAPNSWSRLLSAHNLSKNQYNDMYRVLTYLNSALILESVPSTGT
jgi:hypothetical protein